MKGLPYFRWYPADAETDENYSSLNDRELGFFHRCLNRAWLNNGLPADLDQLAKAMHVTRSYLNSIWPKVGRCFVHHPDEVHRIVNPRQEQERSHATAKSLTNQRNRLTNVERPPRARFVSDSVSVSSSSGGSAEGGKSDGLSVVKSVTVTTVVRARFVEWIRPWPRDPAPERSLHAFVFCWSPEEDEAIFACRDRFLASNDAAEGVCQNPERFLNEQKQNGWHGKWPPARRGPAKASGAQAMLDLMAERVANGRRPL